MARVAALRWSTTQAQFVAVLNYLAAQFPGNVQSTDPTQYALAKMPFERRIPFPTGTGRTGLVHARMEGLDDGMKSEREFVNARGYRCGYTRSSKSITLDEDPMLDKLKSVPARPQTYAADAFSLQRRNLQGRTERLTYWGFTTRPTR